MLRISVLAPIIFGFTTVAVCAEDARQLTCDGSMIEPAAISESLKPYECAQNQMLRSARKNPSDSKTGTSLIGARFASTYVSTLDYFGRCRTATLRTLSPPRSVLGSLG